MRVETIGPCTLYLGDCREIIPQIKDFDAVVTSPPYANQRSYGIEHFDWDKSVAESLCAIAQDNCQVLVNLGLCHENGRVNRYWDTLIAGMELKGWRLFGWYVWDQGDGLPGNWNGRLAPSHEFVFHFNKVALPSANKWVRTNMRAASGTGLRGKNDATHGLSSPDKCGQPFKIADSVIRVYRQTDRSGVESSHPALFPIKLPLHLIQSFTSPGQCVFDPFMGSGTTGVACIKLGREFIGVEIVPEFFDLSCRRIEEVLKQPDMFARPAPVPVEKQEAML